MRLVLTILLSLASACALARPPSDAPAVNAEFYALDRNRDGYVSRLEAAADREIAKRFSAFDVDNDGRLSESEFMLAKDDNDKRAVRDALFSCPISSTRQKSSRAPAASPQR